MAGRAVGDSLPPMFSKSINNALRTLRHIATLPSLANPLWLVATAPLKAASRTAHLLIPPGAGGKAGQASGPAPFWMEARVGTEWRTGAGDPRLERDLVVHLLIEGRLGGAPGGVAGVRRGIGELVGLLHAAAGSRPGAGLVEQDHLAIEVLQHDLG